MNLKMNRALASALALVALTLTTTTAFAAEPVKIPAKAISPRTFTVIYVNTDAITIPKIKATAHVFIDAIPDKSKKLREKLSAALDKKTSKEDKTFTALQDFRTQAHIHGMMLSFTAPKKNTGQPSILFLAKGDSSTSAAGILKAMKQAQAQIEEDMDAKDKEKDQDIPKVTRFSGNWFLIQDMKNGKVTDSIKVPSDGGDTATTAKFQSILNRTDDSALFKLALISNQKIKEALSKEAKQSTGPQATLARNFQAMDTALITGRIGSNPALDVTINFTDAKAATTAGQTITRLLNMAKSVSLMKLSSLKNRPNSPMAKNAPSPALVKDIFKQLMPKAEGSAVSIGLHTQFIQDLAKLVPSAAPVVKPLLERFD